MENEGDTKKTVKEWLDFLNSEKQTIMSAMTMDELTFFPLGTFLIVLIVSIAEGDTHWARGVLGILVTLFCMLVISIHARFKILLISGIINIQHEILKGELKEVKDISEFFFSLVPKKKSEH